MALKLHIYPSVALVHVCKPLKKVDKEVKGWLAEMSTIMHEGDGIGLAANQVGLPYRMFITNVDRERAFINPIIKNYFGGRSTVEEGCLSLPGIVGNVERSKKVKIEAYSPDGKFIENILVGLEARAFQHEFDHLSGMIFPERMSDWDLRRINDSMILTIDEHDIAQRAGEVDDAQTMRFMQILEEQRC